LVIDESLRTNPLEPEEISRRPLPRRRKPPLGLSEQEQKEETEKETSVRSVISCLALRPMHPLFQKASGLTETIIAAAIEVHQDKGPGLHASARV